MKEVHIKQRNIKSGTMYEYWFEVASIDGKRKRVTKGGYKTKTMAKEAGKKAQQEYEQLGHTVSYADVSFSDFIDKWLSSITDLKASTIKGYEKNARLYIKPILGHYRLKAIDNDMCQQLIINLYDSGMSKNTLSNISGVLSSVFKYAVINKYLAYSPIVELKIPKNRTPKKQTISEPHIYIDKAWMKKIIDRFPKGSTAYLPLMLGYTSGMRIGEAFALTWDDIDFDNREIAIRRQIQWQAYNDRGTIGKGGNRANSNDFGYWIFSAPKYNSQRVIDILDDGFLQFLKDEKAKQEKDEAYYAEFYQHYYLDTDDSGNDYLTTTKTDRPIKMLCVRSDGSYTSSRIMQHTTSVIKKMGLSDFDYHSLRHTHATELVNQGAKPQYVQNRLGHKKIEITMNTYYHLTDDERKKQSAELSTIF